MDRELIEAAGEKNLPEVCRLLSAGADVNAKGTAGETPLLEASVMGHSQVVLALLEHGADMEAKDNRGRTPLHWASMVGHSEVVKEFLDHGADIDATTPSGWTPLHWASFKGHSAVVNELISPHDGATASILGKRKSRGGADIEAKTNRGETPLYWASGGGHLPVVKALLSGGADILAADDEGELPIHFAVVKVKPEVSKYLFQHFYATTRLLPLHDFLEELTWIPNPNCGIIDVRPLHAALELNVLGTDDVVEILEYLVGLNPAALTSRDRDGSLPLHLACRRGASFTIVQSLVNLYKASVKSMTPQGDLPLFLACEMPETSLDTIFILIKLYPDLIYR
jgi:ankyrin repeat protein